MLVICMVVLGIVVKDVFSRAGIISLFVLNLIGFGVDVVLVDSYDAI